MNSNLRLVTECATDSGLCFTDVHWAAEQAMFDARTVLRWSRPKLAQRIGMSLNTVKRWERGETTIQSLVFERAPQFAAAWREAFEKRKAEIRRAA